MTIISTRKFVKIWGNSNAWSLEPGSERDEQFKECETLLEIQGDDKNGYYLVISPEGFFIADYWYETRQEAIESAKELFGVSEPEWS